MSPGGEVPKPKAPAGAKGVFTATVTESGSTRTISWKLTFRGLSGKAVAAHIHKGKAGVAGAVIVPLCGPCKNGQTGKLKVSKDVADVLERGGAYVNVHTAKNAAGEIRGQIKLLNHVTTTTTTPDPGTTTTITPHRAMAARPGTRDRRSARVHGDLRSRQGVSRRRLDQRERRTGKRPLPSPSLNPWRTRTRSSRSRRPTRRR